MWKLPNAAFLSLKFIIIIVFMIGMNFLSSNWKGVLSLRYSLLRRPVSSTSLSSSFNEHMNNNQRNQIVEHLMVPNSKIKLYWIEQLNKIEKPLARNLISRLVPDNPLGFEGGKGTTKGLAARSGTLLDYTIQQKKKHPNKVILIRSGEFYETYGIDALMLIAYAGLNPMGNKPKAGCPVKNVQATLDGLTSHGLSVAVYEEIADIESSKAASNKVKIKNRVLMQIVSPASSTYIHDLCLRDDNIDFQENRPVVGLLKTTLGYTLCCIYLDEQCMTITERLTEEAVRSLLAYSGVTEPVYAAGWQRTDLAFLQANYEVNHITGYSEMEFPSQILHKLSNSLEVDISAFRFIKNNHYLTSSRPRPIYTSTALQIGLSANENVPNLIPYLLPAYASSGNHAISMKFLKKWLMNPPPSELADHMQTLCRQLYITQLSLPTFTAVSPGKLVSFLTAKQCNVALFRDLFHNLHGLAYMLEAAIDEQPNQLNKAAKADKAGKDSQLSPLDSMQALLTPLLAITRFESGIAIVSDNLATLLTDCSRVMQMISQVIILDTTDTELLDPVNHDPQQKIPEEFFKRNEEEFRGKIIATNPEIQTLYKEIDQAAQRLCQVILEEVPQGCEIVHDMMENAIMLREKPKEQPVAAQQAGSQPQPTTATQPSATSRSSRSTAAVVGIPGVNYIKYVDRKNKITSKYTTENLQAALAAYLRIAEIAPLKVTRILQALSQELLTEMMIIIPCAHFAVILLTAYAHTMSAQQKGWHLPALLSITEDDDEQPIMLDVSGKVVDDQIVNELFDKPANQHDGQLDDHLDGQLDSQLNSQLGKQPGMQTSVANNKLIMQIYGLTPYWLPRDTAIANDLALQGIFLLTAPNMSGKSTLMRSALVAALLANCGLFIPAKEGSQIPRFDNFFLRTASYDIPSEAKSAFALEMDDMRVVLRDCSAQSLVMIDELGKGTSARDGSALAGALLEYLDDKRIYGIFATHLHELFLLPLQLQHVIEKKMGYTQVEDDEQQGGTTVRWNYQLEDGRCEDSMALVTARRYGIHAHVLERAEELVEKFNTYCRPSTVAVSVTAQSDYGQQQQEQTVVVDDEQKLQAKKEKDGRKELDDDMIEQHEQHSPPKVAPLATPVIITNHKLRDQILPIIQSELADLQKQQQQDQLVAYEQPSSILYIPSNHQPPASLEGRSAVYILHIYPNRKKGMGVMYVGETESLHQRLRQHRLFYARRQDCSVACLAFNLTDKSSARRMETLLIQILKKHGLPFDRDADESHSLFSRRAVSATVTAANSISNHAANSNGKGKEVNS